MQRYTVTSNTPPRLQEQQQQHCCYSSNNDYNHESLYSINITSQRSIDYNVDATTAPTKPSQLIDYRSCKALTAMAQDFAYESTYYYKNSALLQSASQHEKRLHRIKQRRYRKLQDRCGEQESLLVEQESSVQEPEPPDDDVPSTTNSSSDDNGSQIVFRLKLTKPTQFIPAKGSHKKQQEEREKQRRRSSMITSAGCTINSNSVAKHGNENGNSLYSASLGSIGWDHEDDDNAASSEEEEEVTCSLHPKDLTGNKVTNNHGMSNSRLLHQSVDTIHSFPVSDLAQPPRLARTTTTDSAAVSKPINAAAVTGRYGYASLDWSNQAVKLMASTSTANTMLHHSSVDDDGSDLMVAMQTQPEHGNDATSSSQVRRGNPEKLRKSMMSWLANRLSAKDLLAEPPSSPKPPVFVKVIYKDFDTNTTTS